jgi:AbrB family looped-hinge helix DNA binding protein
MATATVSLKGQVSLPKTVRDRLHLKAGTELTIEVQGESLVMKRAAPELPHWETMRGCQREAKASPRHWKKIARSRTRITMPVFVKVVDSWAMVAWILSRES